MDVTDDDSIQNAATHLKDVAIDVLINNAGITGAPCQSTGRIDYSSWAKVLDVNTMGPCVFLKRLSTASPAASEGS